MTQPDLGAGFRCAGASLLRNESVAGTASNVRAFLLVEYTGAWGVNALRDARLPDGLGNHLLLSSHAVGVRVLLVRRPDRSGTDEVRVFAAYADPVAPWLETAAFSDVHEVLDLELAALGRGRSIGLEPTDGSLFCVCTHGKHDACCAERGRPVAAALETAHREETWEVSHIGGDRFAANMLVLPHGLYYGRLDAVSALGVAGSHLAGGLELDHLRGRSGLGMPAQAAEIGLRRRARGDPQRRRTVPRLQPRRRRHDRPVRRRGHDVRRPGAHPTRRTAAPHLPGEAGQPGADPRPTRRRDVLLG